MIIFAVTSFYTDFLKQPRIAVDFKTIGKPTNNTHYTYILTDKFVIQNAGGASAKSVRFSFNSPDAIIKLTEKKFYNESLREPSPTEQDGWSVLNFTRISPNSIVDIPVILYTNRPTIHITTLTTYDEGSVFRTFTIDATTNEYIESPVNKTNIDLRLPIILLTAAGISYLISRIYRRIRDRTVIEDDRLLDKLAFDICLVYRTFTNNIQYYYTFYGKLYSAYLWSKETITARQNLFEDKQLPPDSEYHRDKIEIFNDIQEFFHMIKIRDNAIKDLKCNINDLNSKVISLIGNIFETQFGLEFGDQNGLLRIEDHHELKYIVSKTYDNSGKVVWTVSPTKVESKKIMFRRYYKSLFRQAFTNTKWWGWLFGFLVFLGIVIIVILIFQPPEFITNPNFYKF